MSEEIIFCTQWSGEKSYGWFWHEADVLLYALGQEVAAQLTTPEQAREIYARHYGSRNRVGEQLEEALVDYGSFPTNEELDYLPNSTNFWEEADRLHLEGVGFSDDISPASDPAFTVDNEDAFNALKKSYEGRYKIVLCKDINDYVISDQEAAVKFVERKR